MICTVDETHEIDRETAGDQGRDMQTERDLLDADAVGNEITVIGETIPMMTGLEDGARTLLTHGPVTEVTRPAREDQTELPVQSLIMYVHITSGCTGI
jgi:hypothetical protein